MGTGFSKRKKEARMMQEQLGKMQQQMKETEVIGKAPNDLVIVVMNGENELKSIKIKPECVDKDDVEGLQDLIKVAFNDAAAKVKSQSMEGMGGMGGMGGLSGLMGGMSQFGL